MSEKLDKYIAKKKLAASGLARNIRVNKVCYLFLLRQSGPIRRDLLPGR